MADDGTECKPCFKLRRERIDAVKEIWTKTGAEYHGEMVDFPEMMAWPKPVQKPHPPVLVGGTFPHAARGQSVMATAGCRLPAGRPMATSTNTCRASDRCWRKPGASHNPYLSRCSVLPQT